MKGYKGFDKDFKCRGKQYAENTVFEEDGAELCKSGMHFCENPMAVLNYYGFVDDKANLNEFAEVEALGDVKTNGDKSCTDRLKVGTKLGIAGLVNAFVDFTLEHTKQTKSNTGNCSAATNTGNRSAATNTGDCSAATNTGNRSAATNTGNCSAATNTGDWSAATNTGNCSAATNTGDWSAATVSGTESVALAIGCESKAKGSLGCWIVLAEWDSEGTHILDVKSHKVDGIDIQPNRFYTLKDGRFVLADDE